MSSLLLILPVNESIQQQIPQAILARKQREAEKKQKKEQLLALTTSSSTSYDPDVAGVGDALVCLGDAAARDRTALCAAGAMLGEDERPPAPPPEDQYTAPRPFAAPVDKYAYILKHFCVHAELSFIYDLQRCDQINCPIRSSKWTEVFGWFRSGTLFPVQFFSCFLWFCNPIH